MTLGGHSSGSLIVPRCKTGTGLGLEIQSVDSEGGSLRASESRTEAMVDPPRRWNPWVGSTEFRYREHQWLHKMVTCHRKKLKKKHPKIKQFLNINLFRFCYVTQQNGLLQLCQFLSQLVSNQLFIRSLNHPGIVKSYLSRLFGFDLFYSSLFPTLNNSLSFT